MSLDKIKKGDILQSGILNIKIAAKLDDIIFYFKNKYSNLVTSDGFVNEYDELEAEFMTIKQLRFRGFHFIEDK